MTEVALDFLEPGREYVAQIYRDGANADYEGDQFDFVTEEKRVTAADKLSIRMGRVGGFAVRFVAR